MDKACRFNKKYNITRSSTCHFDMYIFIKRAMSIPINSFVI